MIGKSEWFKIRKFGGWGITPATKEGWYYIAGITVPIIIFQSLPWWNDSTRLVVMTIWLLVLFVDVVDIMRKMKKDERERAQEAIADRNAAWWMIGVLMASFLYETISKAMVGEVYIDPVIAVAILGAAVVKSISFWYLRDK